MKEFIQSLLSLFIFALLSLMILADMKEVTFWCTLVGTVVTVSTAVITAIWFIVNRAIKKAEHESTFKQHMTDFEDTTAEKIKELHTSFLAISSELKTTENKLSEELHRQGEILSRIEGKLEMLEKKIK